MTSKLYITYTLIFIQFLFSQRILMWLFMDEKLKNWLFCYVYGEIENWISARCDCVLGHINIIIINFVIIWKYCSNFDKNFQRNEVVMFRIIFNFFLRIWTTFWITFWCYNWDRNSHYLSFYDSFVSVALN